jgi:hypothetical protein
LGGKEPRESRRKVKRFKLRKLGEIDKEGDKEAIVN